MGYLTNVMLFKTTNNTRQEDLRLDLRYAEKYAVGAII